MLLVSTPFTGLVRNQARVLGLPSLTTVVLQHPVGGTSLDSVLAKVDGAMDEVITKLTTPLPAAQIVGKGAAAARSEWIDIDISDEWSGLQREFATRGWSDGMLMAPPTEERVAAMVDRRAHV